MLPDVFKRKTNAFSHVFWLKVVFCTHTHACVRPRPWFRQGTDTACVLLFTSQPSQGGFPGLTDVRETTHLNPSACWTAGSPEPSYVLHTARFLIPVTHRCAQLVKPSPPPRNVTLEHTPNTKHKQRLRANFSCFKAYRNKASEEEGREDAVTYKAPAALLPPTECFCFPTQRQNPNP